MKMWFETFSGGDMFACVTVAFSAQESDESCESCSMSHHGVRILFDDSSSRLTGAYEDSTRECLLELADRWETLSKALRERAAQEPAKPISCRQCTLTFEPVGPTLFCSDGCHEEWLLFNKRG